MKNKMKQKTRRWSLQIKGAQRLARRHSQARIFLTRRC